MDSYLGGPNHERLDHALHIVCAAFDETCYLVGSATKTREFRDVDVRMILDDKKWAGIFGPYHAPPLRSLVAAAVSAYLEQQTGLPVDFQVQMRSRVKDDDWNKIRVPLGRHGSLRSAGGEDLRPPWMIGAHEKKTTDPKEIGVSIAAKPHDGPLPGGLLLPVEGFGMPEDWKPTGFKVGT